MLQDPASIHRSPPFLDWKKGMISIICQAMLISQPIVYYQQLCVLLLHQFIGLTVWFLTLQLTTLREGHLLGHVTEHRPLYMVKAVSPFLAPGPKVRKEVWLERDSR